MDGREWTLVEDGAGVTRVAERATGAQRIALDTEANGFHAYRPRLCLVQLAWERDGQAEVALIDALACAPHEWGPLRELFADASVEKTIHGADYDVRLLARDLDVSISGLYDTQIAALFLGLPRTGLAALALEFAGLDLDKGAQKLDWAARPIPEVGLRYAGMDVRAVLAIRAELGARLEAAGRDGWAREEFLALEKVRAAEPREDFDPQELLARVTGAGKLDPRQRAVLGEVLLWREVEARDRDVPAVHIAPPLPLLEAVKRDVSDLEGLIRAGVPARIARRVGRELLRAMDRGRRADPLPLRVVEVAPPPPEEQERSRRLRAARNQRAEELGLDPGVLCSTAMVKEVARHAAAGREALALAGLRRWQIEAAGDALLAALSP